MPVHAEKVRHLPIPQEEYVIVPLWLIDQDSRYLNGGRTKTFCRLLLVESLTQGETLRFEGIRLQTLSGLDTASLRRMLSVLTDAGCVIEWNYSRPHWTIKITPGLIHRTIQPR